MFLISFFRSTSLNCEEYVYYTHISDSVQTVYELPLLPNNTVVKHFCTNRSGAKCWPDIYHWGAGLVVTGPMRDIGQKVLQSAFGIGSGNSHSYCHILFLMAFLEEAFIRNIKQQPYCIN